MKVCVCIYGVKLGVLNYVEYFSTEIGAEGILAWTTGKPLESLK